MTALQIDPRPRVFDGTCEVQEATALKDRSRGLKMKCLFSTITLAILSGSLFGACGGDAPGDTDTGADTVSDTTADSGPDGSGEIAAAERPALPWSPTSACRLDLDCDAGMSCFVGGCAAECSAAAACALGGECDERGRCVSTAKSVDQPPSASDMALVGGPARSQLIADDAVGLTIDLELGGTAIAEALAYRLEDSEGLFEQERILATPIIGSQASISLPLSGAYVRAREGGRMGVRIRTEAGIVNLEVAVSPRENGAYSVQARIEQFGTIALPMEFEIVTEPADVALADADAAWLVLPSGPSDLFAPRPGTGADEVVARPLVYDALVDRWVAVTRYDFPLGAGVMVGGDAAEPQRSLRIQLAYEAPGRVHGEFTDRWSGLFDVRSSAGVRSPSPVVFEGTFEGTLSGTARPASAVVVDVDDAAVSEVRPLAALDACTDEMFPTTFGTVTEGLSYETTSGRVYRCESPTRISGGSSAHYVDSVSSFISASDQPDVDTVRAECALAVAETALAGETTAALLQSFFDGDGATPGDRSFDAFMDDCAAGVDGLCRPSDEILCARELLAYAYSAPTGQLADAELVVEAFQRVSREAFLGRQLGAFQADASLRLSWLESSDFPAIVTATLRDFTGGLLETWQTSVLDVQLDVLALQYDSGGLALLSRQVSDADAVEGRQQLLFEMTQSWRGAMDALTLAAQRWNALYVSDVDRAEASSLVATRTRALYVLAGVAQSLNLRGGAGFANGTFASGFGALSVESGRLALSFDELVYARDGEVVVSRSLDPESSNFDLLRRLREEALASVGSAAESVGAVISEGTEQELTSAQVRNRLNGEIDALGDELVEVCGLPAGCTRSDVGIKPECAVAVEAGRCGYVLVEDTGGAETATGVNVSEAAASILRLETAVQNILIAQSEITTLANRVVIAQGSAESFASLIEGWNDARLASVDAVDEIIAARAGEWSGALESLTAAIADQNRLRGTLATDAQSDAAAWKQIRIDGIAEDYANRLGALVLDGIGLGVDNLFKTMAAKSVAAAQALPAYMGSSTDSLTKLSRGMILTTAQNRGLVTKVLSISLKVAAARVNAAGRRARLLQNAELVELADQDLADDTVVRNQIAALEAAVSLELTEQQVAEFGVDRLIEALRARTEAELAYGRDLVELQERRQRAWLLAVDLSTLQARLGQTFLASGQRLLEIDQTTQRAQLLAARLAELKSQRSNINSLLGSPAVVFAWANRLSQAESELDRAKSSMINWLVGLEYFAVRPFMDQRIQILLARNTYQLEAIAAEMIRLESVCGGNTNAASATVSLANLLGFDDTRVDAVDEAEYGSGELFRAALARASVSVDRKVRLGSAFLAADLWGEDGVWAVEFPLGIKDFANLGASCNAKILSIDIALVGEGLGAARPAVTLVHSGASTMRSCQPDLPTYVDQFGAGATSFDEVTLFRTESRGISPVADVGGFDAPPSLDAGNFTLGGLPVAADYVLMIRRDIGENRDIPWTNLDDVLVRVNYTFQDFFPRGACQ